MEKKEFYSIADIVRCDLIPPLKTAYLIKKQIESGKLRALPVGKGTSKRYLIKHKVLMTFIENFEKQF